MGNVKRVLLKAWFAVRRPRMVKNLYYTDNTTTWATVIFPSVAAGLAIVSATLAVFFAPLLWGSFAAVFALAAWYLKRTFWTPHHSPIEPVVEHIRSNMKHLGAAAANPLLRSNGNVQALWRASAQAELKMVKALRRLSREAKSSGWTNAATLAFEELRVSSDGFFKAYREVAALLDEAARVSQLKSSALALNSSAARSMNTVDSLLSDVISDRKAATAAHEELEALMRRVKEADAQLRAPLRELA